MTTRKFTYAARRLSSFKGRGFGSQGTRRNSVITSGSRFTRNGGIAGCTRAAAVMAFSFILLACASAVPPHIGKTVRPDNRFPLAGLPKGEATWTAPDLKLHYRATTVGNNLDISGFVEFSSNLAKYPTVNAFRIYLHFLDAAGVVLDTKLLWTAGVGVDHRFVRWTFQRKWPPPPGALAVGFSYRGGVSEPGGNSGVGQTNTGWEVQQAP